VRRWFVEQDLIEGVIYLPDNIFYNTSSPGIIIVLNKAKRKDLQGTLFLLNASREFTKGDPKNFIPDDAISRIADTFSARNEVEKYSRMYAIPGAGLTERHRFCDIAASISSSVGSFFRASSSAAVMICPD
jgi:type I restriction-modification system DNA methylase subunit